MTRQIHRVGPVEGRLRTHLIAEGMCPFCQVMLMPDPVHVDLDGRLHAKCPCCGWWWHSSTEHGARFLTLGADSLCDHVDATWEE